MGQYEPRDSRDVTLNRGHEPGGLERTGPREHETRQQEQRDERRERRDQEQMGYGNARDADDRMEQEQAEQAQPGEVSDNPARRAEADADRPLGKD